MKKLLFILFITGFYSPQIFGQAERVLGPVEKRVVDTICNGLAKVDLSKISTRDEATAAYTQVIEDHADMLSELANERHVDITDVDAMKRVGIDLAFDLYKIKCEKFAELAKKMSSQATKNDMAQKSEGDATLGTFRRVDHKGFNYIVITDADNNEKSFLWLRQFSGFESFMRGVAPLIGKKVTISWKTIEVYLPEAKGYYPVKEITGITVQ